MVTTAALRDFLEIPYDQMAALAAEKTIHERTFEPRALAAEFSDAIRRGMWGN